MGKVPFRGPRVATLLEGPNTVPASRMVRMMEYMKLLSGHEALPQEDIRIRIRSRLIEDHDRVPRKATLNQNITNLPFSFSPDKFPLKRSRTRIGIDKIQISP